MHRAFGLVLVVLASCEEAPVCPDGQHREGQNCVEDVTQLTVTIGAGCAIAPDPFHVGAGKYLRFKNDDAVDHEIHGVSDGQLWASVKAGQYSPETSIAKTGTWAYTVSGCAKGGTLVVE